MTELEFLNELYLARKNSLARYIPQASPYLPKDKEQLLEAVEWIASMDEELTENFEKYFDQIRYSPFSRTIDPFFAELNYLSIDYLANLLLQKITEEQYFIKELGEQHGELSNKAFELVLKVQATLKEQFVRLSSMLSTLDRGSRETS